MRIDSPFPKVRVDVSRMQYQHLQLIGRPGLGPSLSPRGGSGGTLCASLAGEIPCGRQSTLCDEELEAGEHWIIPFWWIPLVLFQIADQMTAGGAGYPSRETRHRLSSAFW
ncbi:unnamed protein product [Phytophthora fragariaefolia]|uniref:Unnamed protein product n=1 Tax=Phytophthora fragariaefolia TaxID=1490495 RepID=A0A9W7CW17_9STRA|nr:unnamed protein product [Phytophthora fragariaefolia]